MLDEILDPTLEAPAPQAIDKHQPELVQADAGHLAVRLQDEAPLHPFYKPARPSLLVWLVAQPGNVGDEAALDVIAGRAIGSEHGNVRQAAYRRCSGNARLLSDAAAAVADEFVPALARLRAWSRRESV